ncbi:hypothetical protein VTN96DRAFT_9151 [Rasamsonia emersonii]
MAGQRNENPRHRTAILQSLQELPRDTAAAARRCRPIAGPDGGPGAEKMPLPTQTGKSTHSTVRQLCDGAGRGTR